MISKKHPSFDPCQKNFVKMTKNGQNRAKFDPYSAKRWELRELRKRGARGPVRLFRCSVRAIILTKLRLEPVYGADTGCFWVL